jgi:hypothetical protein
MENELFLIYVNPIGKDSKGLYQYEFFFSETPETVWGNDWNVACPSACGDTLPEENTYSVIKLLKTEMILFCAQQNSCFSLQDCIDGLICLCAEDISDYESYPEPFRLVLHFSETYDSVISKFNDLNLNFEGEDNNKEDEDII